MSPRPASELLLYDSEATLRLVESAIEDIRELESAGPDLPSDPAGRADVRDVPLNGESGAVGLAEMIERSYAEVVSVLGTLRESLSVLSRTVPGSRPDAGRALRDGANMASAMGPEAPGGLDRVVAVVNAMDDEAQDSDATARAARRRTLGAELSALASCATGQELTAPRLSFASAVLAEMEIRLAALATGLDQAARAVDRRTP